MCACVRVRIIIRAHKLRIMRQEGGHTHKDVRRHNFPTRARGAAGRRYKIVRCLFSIIAHIHTANWQSATHSRGDVTPLNLVLVCHRTEYACIGFARRWSSEHAQIRTHTICAPLISGFASPSDRAQNCAAPFKTACARIGRVECAFRRAPISHLIGLLCNADVPSASARM